MSLLQIFIIGCLTFVSFMSMAQVMQQFSRLARINAVAAAASVMSTFLTLPFLVWALGKVAVWLMPGVVAAHNAAYALIALAGGVGMIYGLVKQPKDHHPGDDCDKNKKLDEHQQDDDQ